MPGFVAESAARLSSDGRLLVIREFDERLKFIEGFAAALEDTRDPTCTLRSRMCDGCEERGLTYTFGFSMNPRLQRETQAL